MARGSSGSLATGGSDYHGDTTTYAETHAALRVPDEVADAPSVRRSEAAGSRTMPGR